MWRSLLAGVLVITTTACSFDYRGDGEFVDQGIRAVVDRYVLDLGKVQPGTLEYRVGALPRTEFVVGLQIAGLSPDQAESLSATVDESVRVMLVNTIGVTQFDQSAPLRDWVWTCGVSGCGSAYAYLRDLREEGGTQGTYFVPCDRQAYQLLIDIPITAFFEAHEVHLMISGGGWK